MMLQPALHNGVALRTTLSAALTITTAPKALVASDMFRRLFSSGGSRFQVSGFHTSRDGSSAKNEPSVSNLFFLLDSEPTQLLCDTFSSRSHLLFFRELRLLKTRGDPLPVGTTGSVLRPRTKPNTRRHANHAKRPWNGSVNWNEEPSYTNPPMISPSRGSIFGMGIVDTMRTQKKGNKPWPSFENCKTKRGITCPSSNWTTSGRNAPRESVRIGTSKRWWKINIRVRYTVNWIRVCFVS